MINDYLPVDSSDLGEGPLWHPKLKSLFWFDINSFKMHNWSNSKLKTWVFSEPVSAAGWIDEEHLMVATASSLTKLALSTDTRELIVNLEGSMIHTRSNDGRADPWGGFWISTMGLNAEADAGSIYRFYKGELRQLHQNITIPNSICFSPDQNFGYFADTRKMKIWKQKLDQSNGWPTHDPIIFVDLESQGLHPDGSVCDSEGYLWNAQYGASRIARYSPNGQLDQVINFPVSQVTCPAFGGDSLNTIYTTTAYQNLNSNNLKVEPLAGKIFYFQSEITGLAEHQIIA
jgi:sugar lactone lactonase YvrE|tara:strand:+ start:847 stop:1710 length:864 start_codon:yes stop_codon:yes gene_type:complete